jgi:heat shock protein HslJ
VNLWNASKVTLVIVAGTCLIGALAVAGCSSSYGSSEERGDDDVMLLESVDRQATEIGGQAALSGADAAEVTAIFAAGELSGSGGVNRYSATYEPGADGAITVSQAAATLMAGPPAAMEQEQAYFAALEQATGFSASADSLTLIDDQGTSSSGTRPGNPRRSRGRPGRLSPTTTASRRWCRSRRRVRSRPCSATTAASRATPRSIATRPATRPRARRCRSTRRSRRPRWPVRRS